MKTSKHIKVKLLLELCLFSSTLIASLCVHAETPWNYAEGEQSISISFVDDRFDRVWEGETEAPIAQVLQQNVWLGYTIGITEDISLSAKTGYTKTSKSDISKTFEGFSDSSISLKYQLLNEFIDDSIASVSINITGILKGSYERAFAGNPHAPGNKSNGGEISFQVGKFLKDDIAIYMDLGYKKLIDDVPDDILISTGIYYSLNKTLDFNLLYGVKRALDGTDIKDPSTGFDPNFFHQTKENRNWIELSLSYTFIPANTINFGGAQVLSGQNTGKSRIFFIGYQYSIY